MFDGLVAGGRKCFKHDLLLCVFDQLSVGLKKVHSKNKMYPEMQHAVADPFFIPPNG